MSVRGNHLEEIPFLLSQLWFTKSDITIFIKNIFMFVWRVSDAHGFLLQTDDYLMVQQNSQMPELKNSTE